MAHKLMTEELKRLIPGSNSQEQSEDPIVYAHYFSCRNGWDWWVTEGWNEVLLPNGEYEERKLSDPINPGEVIEQTVFFGWVNGFEFEAGPFTLDEFEEANKQYRGGLLAVERDMHWKPIKLSEATKKLGDKAYQPPQKSK